MNTSKIATLRNKYFKEKGDGKREKSTAHVKSPQRGQSGQTMTD